jgi:hypothetical protein
MRSLKKQNLSLPSSKPRSIPSAITPWIFVAALLIVVAGTYQNAFSIPFHYVEMQGIRDNVVVRDLAAFSNKMLTLKGLSQRPLSVLSYAMNYATGGENVFGYHLVNLLIHIFNIVLLFVVARRWVHLPIVATAIFALHPLASAGASQLFGRPYSLATFFMLLALERLSRLASQQKIFFTAQEVLIQSALFLLMILSKQSLVFFPIVALFYAWRIHGFQQPRLRAPWTIWIFGAATLTLLALFCLSYTASLRDAAPLGIIDWALSQLGNAHVLFRLYVLPFQLSYLHELTYYTRASDPHVLLGAGIVCTAIWVTLRYRNTHGWLLGAMLISLIPTNSLFPKNEVIREWRLYPSLVFFSLWAAEMFSVVLADMNRRFLRGCATIALSALLLCFAVTIHRQNSAYQTPLKLWLSVLNKYPNYADAANNIGHFFFSMHKEPEEALKYFQMAQKLDPTVFVYAKNASKAYAAMREFEKAQSEADKADAIYMRYGPKKMVWKQE